MNAYLEQAAADLDEATRLNERAEANRKAGNLSLCFQLLSEANEFTAAAMESIARAQLEKTA